MRGQAWLIVISVVLVASILGTVYVFFWAPTPQEPVLRFTTTRSEYALGDEVTFVLENNLTNAVCLSSSSPWGVQRKVDDHWETVEIHGETLAIVTIQPDDSHQWSWIAEDHPDRDSYGLAAVEPGEYRVGLWVHESCVVWEPSEVTLFAYFQLVDGGGG